MRVLFIGGTGLISSACAAEAVRRGMDLTLLVRGRSRDYPAPAAARILTADIRGDPAGAARALGGEAYDAVVDWVAYTPPHVETDLELFVGRARQFVFISSASVYQKPPVITCIARIRPPKTRSGTTPATRSRARKGSCEPGERQAFP